MVDAALGRGVCSGLKNIAVTRAHHQFGFFDPHLDAAALAGMRRILRVITEAVLASELFSHRAKRGIKILLLCVVKTGASDAGQIVKIPIGEFIFTATGP